MIDFKALAAQATSDTGIDMTKAQKGGGGSTYEPPKAGFCLVRLVGYFEIGKHESTFQGTTSLKDKVQLVFELSGPNHPPKVLEDGTKVPLRITIEENFSLNEKARFFKLFQSMNYKGEAQHMVALMDEPYKARLVHRKYKKRDGSEGTAAELFDRAAGSYTIAPPRVEVLDPDTSMPTGEVKVVPVPPALTEHKAFMWNNPSLEQWDSLFIDGEYPARTDDAGNVIAPARSKNVIQNAIRSAVNFKGSPIDVLLQSRGGKALDIPEPEKVVSQAAAVATDADILNGIV